MRIGCLVAAVTVAVLAGSTPGAASKLTAAQRLCAGAPRGTLGTVANPAIDELSGLVQSRAHAGVLWANNDSGDTARVFALGTDGAELGVVTVGGASAVDWEDLALGPGPSGTDHLFVGDIGGAGTSGNARATVTVYRFPEPAPPGAGQTATVAAQAITLSYPDGPHDAEALLLDARSGDLVLVTKVTSSAVAGVYRAAQASTAPAGSTIPLERVGDLGSAGSAGLAQRLAELAGLGDVANSVTAGDASARAGVALIRTYSGINAYRWSRKQTLADALLGTACRAPAPTDPRFPQGEAVALAPNGKSYIAASEGVAVPLVQFRARR